jgi:hypothetical protein
MLAFLDGSAQRRARLGAVVARSQRRLELGLDHGDRRAQLVAGVGHEALFALERRAEAIEHRVQRLAEPADLVVSGREREPLTVVSQRDQVGAPAHRLHRPEARTGQGKAEQRRGSDRQRCADRKRRDDPGQRLVTVLKRLAHDHRRRSRPSSRP